MADQGVAFELAKPVWPTRAAATSPPINGHSLLEPRRPLMQSWADFVCGKDNAKVVPIKGRIRAPLRRA